MTGHAVPEDLIARYDRPGPRYTSYPTAPEWNDLDEAEARAAFERNGADPRPVSVYVHVPFCERMCLFCGCNVVVAKNRDKIPGYLDAMEREIALVRKLTGAKQAIQLHLGGGTPTFLSPDEIERVAGSVFRAFERASGAEVGIEVDPMLTTREHLEAARRAGFNRLSMGVQDFGDDVQALVERDQPDSKSSEIFRLGRELGFDSVNIDLMYGLPGQTPAHLSHSAHRVIELGADRVAVFGYAHVPWMKPHQKKLEKHGIPAAPERWQMFNAARTVLLDAGYQAIGFDHFAKPTDELARAWRKRKLNRNFQGYTVLEPTDLIGLGVSSISDVGGAYLQNAKRLSAYVQTLEAGRLPVERGRILTDEDRLRRAVITDIMCNLRLDYDHVREQFAIDARQHFAAEIARLEEFVADGLVSLSDRGLEVTERGRVFVRNVAMTFDAYLGEPGGDGGPRFSRTV
jgi:oxygen-independent coproporphyrinogen-3 oxidase